MLTTAGIGAAFGYHVGLRFLIGLFIGTNLVALAVVAGLDGFLQSVPWLRMLLVTVSALYLGYLALRVAMSGSQIGFISASKAPSYWSGILLQIINPKAYAVSTTLFGGFRFMPENLPAELVLKFILVNLVWVPVHLLWLAAGVSLKQLALSPRTQRSINIAMAIAMLIVVGMAIYANFKGS